MVARASSLATPSVRKTPGRRPDPKRSVEAARTRGKLTNTKAQAALVSEDKPLTEQQRLFVKFWAQGESPLSASLKAGYADGGAYAYRMIYMPNILAMYHREKEAYEAASGMTRKRVMDGLLESIEMAKLMAEPSTMVAGWREVGKMCGYYEPTKVQHHISIEGKVIHERLDKLSDDELLELIAKRTQALTGANPLLPPGAPHDDDSDDTGSEAP